MRVTVLGSGSEGNATLVEADGLSLLIDAGFSGRDIENRLQSVGADAADLAGIFVTHDHADHTRGMGVLARRFGLPLYLTARTRAACTRLLDGSERVLAYSSSAPVRVGTLEVLPFLTVHDAADPIAITITHLPTGSKLGVATDLGRPTATVRAALRDSHFLVLEANHDDALLWKGPYPWSVKQRIASSHGHLSNRAAAELLKELFHPGLAGVVLAHLSRHCNDPALAHSVIAATLEARHYRGTLDVAPQDIPLAPVDVPQLRRRTQRTHQLSLL